MMRSLLLFGLSFGLCSSSIQAQSLSPKVIASGGGSASAGGLSISYTYGETFTQTLQAGQTILTQGFQQPEGSAAILGRIRTPNGDSIPYVSLSLIRGNDTSVTLTGRGGLINLNTIPVSAQVLVPSKNNDVLKSNGVSVLDVVLIQSHILANSQLNSPYKLIAADVNRSGTISALDLVLIRKLILGVDTTYPGNRLWAFVDSAYSFSNPSQPFPYPDSIRFDNLNAVATQQNFYGMKLGDVTYDWNPAQLRRSAIPIRFRADSLRVPFTQDTLEIPIRIRDFQAIAGLQFTWSWDEQKLEWLDIIPGRVPFVLNAGQKEKGRVSMIWNEPGGRTLSLSDDEVFFKLRYRRKSGGVGRVRMGIISQLTAPEAYDGDLVSHELIMEDSYIDLLGKPEQTEIYSGITVYPNPTTGGFYLSIPSTEPRYVTVTLIAPNGQPVWNQTIRLATGKNVIPMASSDIQRLSAGVYRIQVQSGGQLQIRSLIINR